LIITLNVIFINLQTTVRFGRLFFFAITVTLRTERQWFKKTNLSAGKLSLEMVFAVNAQNITALLWLPLGVAHITFGVHD